MHVGLRPREATDARGIVRGGDGVRDERDDGKRRERGEDDGDQRLDEGAAGA